MTLEIKTTKSGKFNEYLHHIDLRGLGTKNILSGYAAEFDDCCIFLDCGSSLDVKHLLRYAKNNKIDLSACKYLITSHHHFDHNGGMWKLYEIIKKYNPEVKILTNKHTKQLLNDYEEHLARGKRSYGDLTGIMKPIEENAFKIIEPSTKFVNEPNSLDAIDTFSINGSNVKLGILNTPGHAHDHQSIAFIKDGNLDFLFLGEAVGMCYHSKKLLTLPVSVPIHFSYKDCMNTLENLKKLSPLKAGFCHFGVVNGTDNVLEVIIEHESFMKEFRANVIKYYQEKNETRYICKKITPFFVRRTEFRENHLLIKNTVLSTVYGMMMDLGYRND